MPDPSSSGSRLGQDAIDVAERQRGEWLALESERRFASLVQSIDGVVWEANAATLQFRYVSERAERFLGCRRDEWLTEGFWASHVHPDDRRWVQHQIETQSLAVDSYQLEYRMVAADGRLLWVRDSVSVFREDGRPAVLRGLLLDVTERRATEERLRSQQSRLMFSMDMARLGCWEADIPSNTVSLDDGLLRLLRTTAEVQGGHVMPGSAYVERFIPEEDRSTVIRDLGQGLVATDPRYTGQTEHRLIRADGTLAHVVSRFGIVKDSAGRTIKGYGVVQDLTERKETEDRLKRLLHGESLLASLAQRFIDLPPDDFDAQIVDLLQSVAQFGAIANVSLFMYSPDGRRVVRTHEWAVDESQATIHLVKEFDVGHYSHFREQIARHCSVAVTSLDDLPAGSAERAWCEANGFRPTLLFPLTARAQLMGVIGFYGRVGEQRDFDPDLVSFLGSFAVSVANFISRRKSEEERMFLERQLNQAQKMEAIGTLAGGIAHDFNNILGAIVGNVGLARMELEAGRPVKDSLLEIERAAERAGALVQQILAFSRQQEHERRVIPLAPVVSEAVRFMRATIPAGIAIETSLAGSVPPVVADPTQMHQILLNLGANGWHAMEDGPGRLTIALDAVTLDKAAAAQIGGIGPGRFARVTVTDTGRGMDEATRERIFDPFFTTKTVGKGTGLGMSVVHGIVRSHGGGIAVESEPGQGTTIRIYLPGASGAAAVAAESAPIQGGRGEHLLLIDDEEPIVRAMSRILERLGYRVSAYSRPQEGLDAFRQQPSAYDVVITDYEMPEVTGLAVAREMFALDPGVRILLWSGRFRDEVREEASALGVRALLNKPCPTSVLSQVLRQALEDRAGA